MNRWVKKLNTTVHFLVYLLKSGAACLISLPFRFRSAGHAVWLISERGKDARDNGYFFFEWLRRYHPEIHTYFVISPESADYEKVSKIGKVVAFGSFRHYVLYAMAKYRISTHAWGGDLPNAGYFKKTGLYKISKKRQIFLQHGITKDYQPGLAYPQIMPDLFICGAKPEYEYVKHHFGHPEGVVQYTGFARFDNLKNVQPRNQILVMPTFRKWLQHDDRGQFLREEYFAKWQSVLDNSGLRQVLREKGLELFFYPHYEIQKFVTCFHSDCPQIRIAAFEDYDVQKLLMESKLLVTDFSSVFFDFAYMEKPVLYYQFDRNRYTHEHYDYTVGYFDYDSMGFGKVLMDEEQLVEAIVNCIEENFSVDEVYGERRRKFFPIIDNRNCERIYHAISNLG